MKTPLLAPCFLFAAGTLVGLCLPLRGADGQAILAVVGALLACLLAAGRCRRLDVAWWALLVAYALLGTAAGRGHMAELRTPLVPASLEGRPVRLRGVLLSTPRSLAWGRSAPFRLDRDIARRLRLPRRVVLALPPSSPLEEGSAPDLRGGHRLVLWGTIRSPSPHRNPGSPSFRALRRAGHMQAQVRCKSLLLVERRGQVPAWRPVRIVDGLRRALGARLEGAFGRDPTCHSLLRAMAMGEREALSAGRRRAYARSGTAHLMSVSGLHVGFLLLLLFPAARVLGVGPRITATSALPLLGSYALLTGARAPVLRASLMAGTVVAGRLLSRRAGAANLLAAVLLVLLAVRPGAASSVGLQLSFLAVAGILRLYGHLEAELERVLPWLGCRMRAGLAVTLAAQAAVLPLSVERFGVVSPWAPVVNLLAVPLAAGLLVSGAAVLAVDLVARFLAPVTAEALVGVLSWIPRLLAHALESLVEIAAPHAWSVPPPPRLWSLLWFLLLFLPWPGFAPRLRRATLLVVGGVLCLHPVPPQRPPSGHLRLTALDVGQGDSILLEAGETVVLVDTGGSTVPGNFDVGYRVVAPALRALGHRRLTAVVLTHPDRDHVGGAPALLEELEVGLLARPAGAPGEAIRWRPAERAAERHGVGRRLMGRGDRVKLGPLWLRVLWPPRGAPPEGNDGSLVLEVGLEGSPPLLLLTGDIEAPAEERLAPALVRTVCLKVAHHGSRTSTTNSFLRSVRPYWAVISAGRRNPWGHPHPAVLRRLREGHVNLARTDTGGAFRIVLDARGRALAPSEPWHPSPWRAW